MKIYYLALLVLATGRLPLQASNDAVKDFLQAPIPYVRDPGYYDTDKVLVLKLDLQGNGQTETLVTLNRDRDGKQGNIWQVYRKATDGYKNVGAMTFSPSNFYVGPIEELGGKYGLVTFGSAGAGAGVLYAYVDNGTSIQTMTVSKVTGEVDPTTGDRDENKALKKYLHDKATRGDDVIKKIEAKELAEKYGVHIEKESYLEALHSGFQGIPSK